MTFWDLVRLLERPKPKLSGNLYRGTTRARDEAEAIEELERVFELQRAVTAGEACPICHGAAHDGDGQCPLRANQ